MTGRPVIIASMVLMIAWAWAQPASAKNQASRSKSSSNKQAENKSQPSAWGSTLSPFFGVDDETGGKFGAAAYFYREGEPGVFIGATLVGFRRLDLDLQLTNVKNWFIRSHTMLKNFNERYYGEGPDTVADNPFEIESNFLMQRIWLMHSLTKNIRIGPAYILQVRKELDIDREVPVPGETLEGKIPDETAAGVGLRFEWDTRNKKQSTSAGKFFQTTVWYFPAMMSNRPDKENDFWKIDADFRLFERAMRNVIFANRILLGASIGDPGYLFRYSLGGPKLLRGYGSNRFRGDHSYLNQTELRWQVWKKYLAVVTGIDLGGVVDGEKTRIQNSRQIGLRIGIPPGYNWKIRLDWGFGKDQDLFVIHLNETF